MKDIIPQGHRLLKDNIVQRDNLFGLPAKVKAEWAEKLQLPKHGERIFFAGCGYQFMGYAEKLLDSVKGFEKKGLSIDKAVKLLRAGRKLGLDFSGLYLKFSKVSADRYTSVLLDAVNVLRKLGLDFAYLGEDEPCCGSPIYYSGFVDDFASKAVETYRKLKSLNVREVIGIVPACTNSLKNLYPKFVDGYDLEVKHFVEVVAEEIEKKNIKLKLNKTVVIHDPCQAARYLKITSEPRKILEHIEGLEVREAPTSGELTMCCGGGGGMELTYPELSIMISVNRVKELMETGASTIVTFCPGCLLQLVMGAKSLGADVEVLDIAQIVNQALGGD